MDDHMKGNQPMDSEKETNDELTNTDSPTTETPPEGFIQIPAMRGLFEIAPLMDICDRIGGRIIGGYARYCCSTNEDPVSAGDVDIFPVGTTDEECQRLYDSWVVALKAYGLQIKHENEVSSTWSKSESPPLNRCPTIQVIKPVKEGAIVTKGTIEEILENFDFTIVRVAMNPDRQTATAWASFPDDEQAKRLRILNIHCPISSLLRCMKYARKGYYMRPGESLKLFADWEARSPEYRQRMASLFQAGEFGELSKEEVDELERLLRID